MMIIQPVLNQGTIGKEVSFGGKALQTGRETRVVCRPSAPDSGIVFRRSDNPSSSPVRLSGSMISDSHRRRSTVGTGRAQVQTVEHFLAALWCLGIDNIEVEVNGPELPALDGSAREFITELKKAGISGSDKPRCYVKVTEPIIIKDGSRSLAAYPADNFSVSYTIDYPVKSIGREVMELELGGDVFEKEIAPARTFCLKKEAEFLLKLGLGRGATMENTLVMDETGPMGTTLRFKNEPLRHKMLDLVGDLYLLGRPVVARIVGEKSGHSLNAKLVKELYKRYVEPEGQREKGKGKRIRTGGLFAPLLHSLSFFLNKRKER
jgi:UDP-3-O-[3-hydroxymyristoyl] N-acetylglucosamine deacetylase/3-hydroxyacyl-[acyl-carrier-protein] dehydratase